MALSMKSFVISFIIIIYDFICLGGWLSTQDAFD